MDTQIFLYLFILQFFCKTENKWMQFFFTVNIEAMNNKVYYFKLYKYYIKYRTINSDEA